MGIGSESRTRLKKSTFSNLQDVLSQWFNEAQASTSQSVEQYYKKKLVKLLKAWRLKASKHLTGGWKTSKRDMILCQNEFVENRHVSNINVDHCKI